MKLAVAVSIPTAPPEVVATTVIGEPELTGVRVKLTGTAFEMSPALPSGTSVMAALSEKLAVPSGFVAGIDPGFEDESVTAASSLVTVSKLEPELSWKKGFVLT